MGMGIVVRLWKDSFSSVFSSGVAIVVVVGKGLKMNKWSSYHHGNY